MEYQQEAQGTCNLEFQLPGKRKCQNFDSVRSYNNTYQVINARYNKYEEI